MPWSKPFGRGQGGVSKGQSSLDKAKKDQSNRDKAKAAKQQRDQNRRGGHSQDSKGNWRNH